MELILSRPNMRCLLTMMSELVTAEAIRPTTAISFDPIARCIEACVQTAQPLPGSIAAMEVSAIYLGEIMGRIEIDGLIDTDQRREVLGLVDDALVEYLTHNTGGAFRPRHPSNGRCAARGHPGPPPASLDA